MNKLFVTAAIVALGAASAGAADLPARPYTKAPAMVDASYNWSGFYIGGNVGYGFGRNNIDVTFLPSPADFNADPFSLNQDPRGFLGGVQAGYNWQSGKFIFGGEADIAFGSVRGDGSFRPLTLFGGGGPFPGSFQQTSQKMDWFGTARLRAGFTPVNSLLLYVTGGLAYSHARYNSLQIIDPINPLIQFSGSDSATQVGWTAGGGVEWAFDKSWSVKGEYLYYDLGNHSLAGIRVAPLPASTAFFPVATFQTRGSIVRFGVNYHFNSPVVARY